MIPYYQRTDIQA